MRVLRERVRIPPPQGNPTPVRAGLLHLLSRARTATTLVRIKIFPILAVVAALVFVLAFTACTGTEKPKKVGIFTYTENLDAAVDSFKKALADLGYTDGENIDYIYRNVGGDPSLSRAYLQELLEAEVDVILSVSTHMNLGRPFATVLDGVSDQVLEQPAEL